MQSVQDNEVAKLLLATRFPRGSVLRSGWFNISYPMEYISNSMPETMQL